VKNKKGGKINLRQTVGSKGKDAPYENLHSKVCRASSLRKKRKTLPEWPTTVLLKKGKTEQDIAAGLKNHGGTLAGGILIWNLVR